MLLEQRVRSNSKSYKNGKFIGTNQLAKSHCEFKLFNVSLSYILPLFFIQILRLYATKNFVVGLFSCSHSPIEGECGLKINLPVFLLAFILG